MATTIGSLGEPSSSRSNTPNEERIIRIAQLQETLAVAPADVAARSELATLLEQVDQPEEALLYWNAILSCDPNNLQAREGVARCRRRMFQPLQSNR